MSQQSFSIFGLAISVSNLENSIAWYQNVLGFKLLKRTDFPAINAKGAFLEGAGIRLELLQSDKGFRIEEMFADPPQHIMPIGNKALILYVDDLMALSAELESKDVVFAFKELALNNDGLKSTVIRDIDGNFISIFGKEVYDSFI
jgi:catechol 2,3-dioxygenase-like lactoylglutathione lyase family enzyme